MDMWVVLRSSISVVIDESESSASSTSELCLESENVNAFFLGLEHLGELLFDLNLGYVWQVVVDELDGLACLIMLSLPSVYDEVVGSS